jgi:Rho GTPase-activating protein RGD1
VFGVHLNELFTRDQSPVPLVVYQCTLAIDLFGLDWEGIYRVSGNANSVAQLKAKFDNDMNSVDFRDPDEFSHDVNVPATLLKQFFRDLPDPLLTKAAYREFLEAAAIPDDIARRDSLHAIINNLPDPNYATLRTLILVSTNLNIDQYMMMANVILAFAPSREAL